MVELTYTMSNLATMSFYKSEGLFYISQKGVSQLLNRSLQTAIRVLEKDGIYSPIKFQNVEFNRSKKPVSLYPCSDFLLTLSRYDGNEAERLQNFLNSHLT